MRCTLYLMENRVVIVAVFAYVEMEGHTMG